MKDSDKSKLQLLKELEELKIKIFQLERKNAKEVEPDSTLLQNKVLTRALLNIPTDAVMLIDLDGTLLDVNETTARRYVTFVENLVGTNISEILSKENKERVPEYIAKVIESKNPFRFEDERFDICNDIVLYPVFGIDESVENIAVVSRDITNLKNVQRQLESSLLKYETLIKAIPDMFVRCSRSGVIQDFHLPHNDFPLPFDGASVGKPLFGLLPTKYQHTFIFTVEKAFQTGKLHLVEMTLGRNEKRRILEARIIPENEQWFLVMIREITEQKLIEEKLIEAKEKAENADKLKSNFLAQMSHEIRTPINSIISFTSILKHELYNSSPEDLKECFQNIDSGGRRLIRTMDLLLNMAQIQTGEFELIKKKLDLKDILKRVVPEYERRAGEKNLFFSFRSEIDEAEIEGDEYSVIQIFHNLFDNAVNYTEKGNVDIKLYENGASFKVDVSDSGIGIDEQFLPEIFLPFTQEQTGYTRKF
ncbi:MAG: PAS domain-containing protein, partial [Chlorobi bacterium]|nr:PAS domain-containing protein [Chlorobiota bacterium]